MRKIIDEFKAFIARGNVLDMAIGVIMANAVGKITTSLVNDVIMPITGMFAGSADLSKLNICIRKAQYNAAGELVKEQINIGLGTFISTILDFLIVAFIIFLIVRSINSAHEKFAKLKEKELEREKEHKGPSVEELLTQILEEQKKKNKL